MKSINLISLGRCFDRREAMIRQFAEAGLAYWLIEAVDGLDDAEAEKWEVDRQAFQKIYGREIRAGEIGCAASHLLALERVVGSESDYGIVMEDDVVVLEGWDSDRIGEAVDRAVGAAPDGWAMIYPGNPLMWGSHRYKNRGYGHEDQGKFNENFVQHTELEELSHALIGTQCYIISVRFADYVLTHWNTIYRPIDEIYRILCLDPRFAFFHAPRPDWWCRPNWDVGSEIAGT